jgi:hypothetical protein
VIASAVVQKSYSASYPGEFGGGVINLTTPAVPRESFLDVEFGVSADTETNFQLGYAYYGSDLDPIGFDDGTRDFPAALRDVMAAGTFNGTSDAQRRDFAASLVNAPTTLAQRLGDVPANFSGEVSGGTSTEIRGGRIGFIANIGYDNSWRTRDALQQSSQDPGLAGIPQSSYEAVTTDNRIVVNGLLGIGAEFGRNRIRWTNLYIRDTLKQTRLAAGYNRSISDPVPGRPPSSLEQNTYWFERQLIDSQIVGEFHFGDVNVDVRGGFANSQRESPYERSINYFYLGDDDRPRRRRRRRRLRQQPASGGQFANIAFSDLNEDVLPARSICPTGSDGDAADPVGGYAYTNVSAPRRASSSSISARRRAAARGRAGAARFPALRLQRLLLRHRAARRFGRKARPPMTPPARSMPATPRRDRADADRSRSSSACATRMPPDRPADRQHWRRPS